MISTLSAAGSGGEEEGTGTAGEKGARIGTLSMRAAAAAVGERGETALAAGTKGCLFEVGIFSIICAVAKVAGELTSESAGGGAAGLKAGLEGKTVLRASGSMAVTAEEGEAAAESAKEGRIAGRLLIAADEQPEDEETCMACAAAAIGVG